MPTIRLETAAPSGVLVPVQGRDGTSIRIAGTVATHAELPSSGLTTGDLYVVTADGLGYVWSGTAFPASGAGIQIRGPQGDAGTPGAPGADGTDGANGVDGRTWWHDTGAPGTVTGAVDGDYYLNTTNGDYYQLGGGSTWSLVGNLRGPQGIQGIQGEPGTGGASDWSTLTGKPADFPPSTHTHTTLDITNLSPLLAAKADTARQIIAGTGLTGGGDLTANRTLTVAYGITSSTAAVGNDARLSDARTPTAHTHGVTDLTATGTKDATTFLRGDNTWAAVTGGGPSSTNLGNTVASQSVDVTGAAGKVIRATLAVATTTFSFTNLAAGARWTMEVKQDATGGRAAAWTGVTWVPFAPVIATAANAVNLFEFFSPDGSAIYGFLLNPTVGSAALPYPPPSTRLEPIPRMLAGGDNGLDKGQIWLTHFVPDRDFTVSNIVTHLSGTVGAAATLTRCGIYRYTAANSYSCIARSANTANRWNTKGEKVAAIADNGASSPGAISSVNLTGGLEYAYALITVGNTTAPQIKGISVSDQGTLAPRMGAIAYTQTDLPATLSGITDLSWTLHWAALT